MSALTLLIIILMCVLVIFVSGVMPVDLTALATVAVLVLASFLTPAEAFSGFSSSAVIAMIGMFILGSALKETGVAEVMGRLLTRLAGKRETSAVVAVMAIGAVFSAFMNNVAAVALLMPAVLHFSRISKVPPSRLLMPLAFGVILGGMTTLIGAPPNMIVADIMASRGLVPFHFLDFTPFGVAMLVVGIICVAYYAARFLPRVDPEQHDRREPQTSLAEVYRLNERLHRFRLPQGSPFAGKSLRSSQLMEGCGARIISIVRDGKKLLMPHATDILHSGDQLVVAGRMDDLKHLGAETLVLEAENIQPDIESAGIGVVEVVIPPRSSLIEKTIAEVKFFERYGFDVLALWREGQPRRARFSKMQLRLGDGLLLHGPRSRINQLARDDDLAVVSEPVYSARNTGKAPFAIAAFLLMVVLSVTRVQPIEVSALLAVLLVVLSGAITMEQSYRSVDWRSVALVAGLLPIGVAAEKAGAISALASVLLEFSSNAPPLLLLMAFGVMASFLTQALDSAISVAFLTPIVIQVCLQAGLSPYPFLMMTALSASNAFLLPVSAKANLLVLGPGGYRPTDFLRVGLPLTLLVFLTASLMIPLFLPFK